MDGDCGSISMDRYWNTIGTPFFFIVLGFGLFVLFTMNNIQFASNQHIFNVVAGVLQDGPPSKSKKSAAKAAAEEAEATAAAGNKNAAAGNKNAAAGNKNAAATAAEVAEIQRRLAAAAASPGAVAPRMPGRTNNRGLEMAEEGRGSEQSAVAPTRPGNTRLNSSPV